jgi:ribosome maturation factor RimP
MVAPLREKLIALTEPLLGQLGYELVDLEYAPGRAHALLRIFIDQPAGVGLDDCERVSREVSALMDVEDPVPTGYTLEVSSPGLDRVLRTPAHFQRFIGERVRVELRNPRAGRRRYTGRLTALNDAGIELDVDGAMVAVSFAEMDRARLAPLWS